MFKNGQGVKDGVGKERIFKTHSQLERMSLMQVQVRPRSNSSSSGYSRFSVSSMVEEKGGEKCLGGKMYKGKIGKEVVRNGEVGGGGGCLMTSGDALCVGDDGKF